MRRAALAATCVLTALTMGGCVSPREERPPEPTVSFEDAIPVARAAVEGLPGVESENLTFYEGWKSGDAITGSVDVAADVDAVMVLDQVYSTLWTFEGYEPSTIRVVAERDGEEVATAEDLGSTTSSLHKLELRKRYGPWPGIGPTRARA